MNRWWIGLTVALAIGVLEAVAVYQHGPYLRQQQVTWYGWLREYVAPSVDADGFLIRTAPLPPPLNDAEIRKIQTQ